MTAPSFPPASKSPASNSLADAGAKAGERSYLSGRTDPTCAGGEPPTGWVFRVLPDHRVEMVHNGKVLAAATKTDGDSARLYADAHQIALGGRVVVHGCGGCGPKPGPYRCRRCERLDVLADRRDDEAMWS